MLVQPGPGHTPLSHYDCEGWNWQTSSPKVDDQYSKLKEGNKSALKFKAHLPGLGVGPTTRPTVNG